MNIIIDENLHQFFIEELKGEGYDLVLISERLQGISDDEVVGLVKEMEGLLVTEDSDFGELVFAHQIAKITVVFLRYRKPEMRAVLEHLKSMITEYSEKEGRFFITITSTRIRIREL